MRSPWLIAASVFVVCWTWVAAQAPQQGSAPSNSGVDAALKKGEAALKAERFKDALSAFKQANNLQKQQSAVAFYGISRAYHGLRDYKREEDAAIAGINIAVAPGNGDREMAAQLYNQLGMALSSQAKQPTDPKQREAAEAFYAALALSDSTPIAFFNIGVALMQMGHDDAGQEALEDYLRIAPQTPEAELAKKYIANPQLARDAFSRPGRGRAGRG